MTESFTSAIGPLRAHHFGISVPDLEAAVAWYQRMLGFSLEERLFIEKIPAHIAFVKRGDFRIEIFQVEGAAPLPDDRRTPNLDLKTHGNKHMCFEVPDVPAAVAALRAALVALNDDKDYAADAMTAIQFVPRYEVSADL
ncbi:MAG TPA: VOC family protein, partial [Burkholderiaceae bacterium]|nr:VOC family protein [Burkholderiaceae bacterium]